MTFWEVAAYVNVSTCAPYPQETGRFIEIVAMRTGDSVLPLWRKWAVVPALAVGGSLWRNYFYFYLFLFFSEEFLSSDPGPSQACRADLPGHFRADVSLVKKPQVCPVPASV